MQVDASSVVLVIGGWFLLNVVSELTKVFFQRMRTSDYITRKDCEQCKKQHEQDDEDLVQQIKVIRRLMMRVAIKNGVNTEDIEELVD